MHARTMKAASVSRATPANQLLPKTLPPDSTTKAAYQWQREDRQNLEAMAVAQACCNLCRAFSQVESKDAGVRAHEQSSHLG